MISRYFDIKISQYQNTLISFEAHMLTHKTLRVVCMFALLTEVNKDLMRFKPKVFLDVEEHDVHHLDTFTSATQKLVARDKIAHLDGEVLHRMTLVLMVTQVVLHTTVMDAEGIKHTPMTDDVMLDKFNRSWVVWQYDGH